MLLGILHYSVIIVRCKRLESEIQEDSSVDQLANSDGPREVDFR